MEESSSSGSCVSNKHGDERVKVLMQKLCQCYPARWNHSSFNRLLRDLMIAKVACSQENVHGTMEKIEEELLFPLAEICVMQHEKLISFQAEMSEKDQKYISTFLSLQEEKNELKQGLLRQNMFVETLLQDFDEMGKAVDDSRHRQRHLEQLLEEKESNIQVLISEKEGLINKFVTLGADAVLEWAKQEGKYGDSLEAGPFRYDSVERDGGSKQSNSSESCVSRTCVSAYDKSMISTSSSEHFLRKLSLCQEKRPSLILVTLNGILEEGISSLFSVVDSGVSALPSAVAHFWIGVTGRIARHVSDTVFMKVKSSPLSFVWDP